MINKVKIAVLRGGSIGTYDISMQNGTEVIEYLSKDKYIIFDVVISKKGVWYVGGISITPETILKRVDLAFNILRDNFGDNGRLQKILSDFSVPYIGSDTLSSFFSTNKNLSKKVYKDMNIKTPYYSLIRKENYDRNSLIKLFRVFPIPCVVKPVNGGFSIGVCFVENLNQLIEAVERILETSDLVLVEEFIRGKEIVCGVVDCFRNKKKYSFLPAEIIVENILLDTNSKLGKNFEIMIPPRLSQKEKQEIQNISIKVHNALNLKHYSYSDFIVHPKRGIYLLETNSCLDFYKDSHLLKSLEMIGSNPSDFLDHFVNLVLSK